MFTINLGDWREAPSKARKKGAKRLEFLVFLIFFKNCYSYNYNHIAYCISLFKAIVHNSDLKTKFKLNMKLL